MVDMLRERGCEHIRVWSRCGTIAPHEIESLERRGVEKIYTPRMGGAWARGMIDDVLQRIAAVRRPRTSCGRSMPATTLSSHGPFRCWKAQPCRCGADPRPWPARPQGAGDRHHRTGGAGKSSLTDELLMRLARQFPQAQIAVVAMDPTRRRSGGALLGDRIRMNSLSADNIFMRSLATRRAHLATAAVLKT